MAKSREKIDFMLNELEFIHLSIILYNMLKYMGHTSATVAIASNRFLLLFSARDTH